MIDFIHAISDPNMPIVRFALFAGILASVPFGIMGSYVVTRRISYIAGAISHSVLAGIGIALFIQSKIGEAWWCHPMLGAVVSALLAAIIIGLISTYSKEREDTVIGAVWATGMAIGLIFIAMTPGYSTAMNYLFGNILMITNTDLWVIAGLDFGIVAVCLLFYHKFLAICFDEEFARLRGLKVSFYYLLLLCLTALTIVLLVRIVGIVMVIALLTLPAAIAGYFTARLSRMMILAAILCMVFNILGLAFSYRYDLPSGCTIIVFAAIAYLLTTFGFFIARRGKN